MENKKLKTPLSFTLLELLYFKGEIECQQVRCKNVYVPVYVHVCVWERNIHRETEKEKETDREAQRNKEDRE